MKPLLLASCLLLGLAACGDDDGHSSTVTPDAQTRVSGCDDPAVWTLPALAAAQPVVDMGDYECGPAQLPLHRVDVRWTPDTFVKDEGQYVNRVCWRVTEASPGSGWTAGQQFSSYNDASMTLVGFARPITVEGRALFQDGTVAYAIAPATIQLAPPMILEPDAATVTAVIGRNGWVEHDAVHLWGQRIPTEEVLGVAVLQSEGFELGQMTLHRVGANIVLRTWTHRNNQVEYTDLTIGPGTRARMTKWGGAVLVDGTELVVLNRPLGGGDPSVGRRITLPAEPLEMTQQYGDVLLHLPGMLMRVGLSDDMTSTLAVGDGVLVPAIQSYAIYFFDGTKFREIEVSYTQVELDPIGFTRSAEDLARLGKPVGIFDGGAMIGETGFLAAEDLYRTDIVVGPASASFADVFGGGHLGPLSVEDATYVIEQDDGSAELYQAPYRGYCDPFL